MTSLKLFPIVLGLALASAASAGSAGAAEGQNADIGQVMLQHVSDGHLLELPGLCQGGLSWGCEIDLDRLFGTVRDPASGRAISGPLVLGRLDMTPTKHVAGMWAAAGLACVWVLADTVYGNDSSHYFELYQFDRPAVDKSTAAAVSYAASQLSRQTLAA